MDEEQKLMMPDGSYATSFSELEQIEEVHEQAEEIAELTGKYMALVKNLFEFSDSVDSLKSGLRTLTDEFIMRLERPESEKAVWSRAFINDLPDSAFLYIAPGGEKDEDGKTTPRDLRKFPYKDSSGKVDLPHLRNAIQRIPQSNAPGLTEEKKNALQEKARRILAKNSKGLFEQVKEWVDERIKTLIGKKEEEQQLMQTFKAADGKTWIVLWATNAFVDREKEIFTTKSIDDFIERHRDDEVKGEFWFWHLPGSKFADIKLQSRVGRFLVEAGPFDETEVGQTFKEFFEQYPDGHPTIAPEGWGASHGFSYKRHDRDDGVYEWFDKKESTVLALSAASNPHNPGMSIMQKEDMRVDDKQREEWEKVFGSEFVDKITSTGETKTAILEQTGVDFKGEIVDEVEEEVLEEETTEEAVETPEEEVKEEPVEEVEEAAEEEVAEEEVKEDPISRQEIIDALKAGFGQMREELLAAVEESTEKAVEQKLEGAVDGIIEIITPIAQKVAELAASDEQKIVSKVAEVPAASLQSMLMKSLISDETRIDGRSSLAKDGPEETDSKDATGPEVGGVKLNLW